LEANDIIVIDIKLITMMCVVLRVLNADSKLVLGTPVVDQLSIADVFEIYPCSMSSIDYPSTPIEKAITYQEMYPSIFNPNTRSINTIF